MVIEPQTVARVNSRLFAPFQDLPVKKTELGVLFGCKSASGTVARAGAALFEQGAFPKIMVFGGARVFQPAVRYGLSTDQRSQAPLRDYFSIAREADYMREVLLKHGVPEEAIVFVNATDKHADKICSRLKDALKDEFSSMSAVTYSPYSRRTLGTMRMQGISIPVDVRPVHPFGLTPDNWHESKVAPYVVQEAHNMDPENPEGYVGQFTTEVDLDEEAVLRETLPDLSR